VTSTAAHAPAEPRAESVEEFYAATYPRLVGLLTVASGSRADAEEVVQDAFVRLIPRWGTVSRYDDPEAWVRLVAFRLSHSRRQRANVASRAVTRLGPVPDVAPPDAARVDADRVLAALPREHREVLVLHHALGLPVERIAKELGVPVGTVKSRLARARTAAAAQGGFGDD
jgi:RNA polymerase sigma-70 factor (ECF subfamily)